MNLVKKYLKNLKNKMKLFSIFNKLYLNKKKTITKIIK